MFYIPEFSFKKLLTIPYLIFTYFLKINQNEDIQDSMMTDDDQIKQGLIDLTNSENQEIYSSENTKNDSKSSNSITEDSNCQKNGLRKTVNIL